MEQESKDTPFGTLMSTNPPRLVVLYRQGEDGTQQFQWGMVGTVPVLTLIGSLVEAQARIRHDSVYKCEESAFVVAWEGDRPSYWCHQDVPKTALLGMLETIKHSVVGGRLEQQAAAQRMQILGPDGSPMRG